MKPENRIPNSEGRTGFVRVALFGFRHSEFFRISAFGLRVSALALLAGCKVGPDYKRPEATAIPTAYTGATNVVSTDSGATNVWKVAQPQAQLPKGNWWEIFGDADLNDLERQASAANQQLKVALARLDEARAQMDVTRAGLFPNISLSGSYTRQRTSPNTPLSTIGAASGKAATFSDFLVPLTLGYEVDLWGRVRRSVESARAQAQASADDLETIKLMIQAEVAVDYFTLRALDAQRAVLNSSVQVFTKSLQLTRNLRAGGAVSSGARNLNMPSLCWLANPPRRFTFRNMPFLVPLP